MKQRFALVLIFALVVSAAASVVLYRLIATQLNTKKEVSQNKLVVAAHNLMSGDLIKDADLTLADWSGAVPQGALTKVEDAVNRGVVQPIYSGEPVVEGRIAGRGAGAGLASTIPTGMRAVAVRVNDVVGVSGFAIAGSHVDILIAGNPPNGNNTGTVTKTLLQNIEVLSAGQNTQKDSEGKPVSVPVVNLLVTPEQAEILSLASNDARIQLVLRNPMDKDEVKTPGTALSYLFNGATPPAAAVASAPRPVVKREPPPPPPVPQAAPPKLPPPPITVEVIHGSRKTESKFASEESQEGKK